MTPIARPEPPARVRRRMRPARALGVRAARGVLGALLALAVVLPGAVSATSTWTKNLYVAQAFLYQDPYPTACTAAAAMIMLNTIAHRGTGGNGFSWAPTRIKSDADPADTDDMLSIFAFARAHDSLVASARGSDPHGWRNALNAYGWGADAMTDPTKRVYDDRAYMTFGGAVRAAVRAIARKSMPVGILGWAGGHAQVMTGYVVTGANPAVSNDFTVTYVYLSDPLSSDNTVNRKVSLAAFRSGPLTRRFQAYRQTDSPYDDPYTPGYLRSSVSPDRGPSEWYHRWVVILPVRPGLPSPDPTPTPSPTPTPTPDPGASDSPAPTPTPKAGDAAAATPAPDPTPTPSPTASPTPAATATPDPTPKPDPTASPTPAPTAEPTPTPSPDPTADPSPDASPSSS